MKDKMLIIMLLFLAGLIIIHYKLSCLSPSRPSCGRECVITGDVCMVGGLNVKSNHGHEIRHGSMRESICCVLYVKKKKKKGVLWARSFLFASISICFVIHCFMKRRRRRG